MFLPDTGVVENRMDPLKLGRCQVRIHGVHTHDKNMLPTCDLPWAYPMQSLDSAAMSGIGSAPVGPVEGTVVVIAYRDKDKQQPYMIGTLGGIPQAEGAVDSDSPDLMFDEQSLTTSVPAEIPVVTSIGTTTVPSAPARDYDAEIAALVKQANAKDVQTHEFLNKGRAARAEGNEALAMSYFTQADTANKEAQAILKQANALDAEKKAQPAQPTPPQEALAVQPVTQAPTTPTNAPIGGIPGNAPFGTRSGSNVAIKSSCANGILAVGRAMDQLGITGSYARAAILGIIGGECEWIPQSEGYKYSRNRIKEVFSWMTDAQADQYASWKGSREDFFRFVYGPTTRSGKNLGNKGADDGAKYYGRGYVQLTGAYNYARYGKMAGVDLVNNPDLMNDPVQGALISVSYFKDRVKCAQNDPGYFDAACSAVGFNVPNIKAKKKAYYQYFLIADAKATEVPQKQEQSATPGEQPPNVKIAESGFPQDRQQSLVLGFRDPNMKYPLREFLNEPDTNRLARGRVDGTMVQTRDNTRMTEIPTADGSTWSQPPIPYNARYPYNRMRASESGHIFELDDTPDNERVNLNHRTGTFVEMDVNGTQVNRIVGDGYEIIDRNGYVYVKGAYNITSEGFTTIYVNADAHIRVAGHTQIDMEQDCDWNIARDLNFNVGGNVKWDIGGWKHVVIGKDRTVNVGDFDTLIVTNDQTINIGGGRTDKIAKDNQTNIDGDTKLKVGGKADADIGGNNTVKIGGDQKFDVSGKNDLKIGGNNNIQVGAAQNLTITGVSTSTMASAVKMVSGVDAKIATGGVLMTASSIAIGATSGSTTISTSGDFKLKTTGNYSIDANVINLNNGSASDATNPNIPVPSVPTIGSADSVQKADSAQALPTASPPSFGNPANNRFQNLTTPPRNFEIDTSFETPEEIATDKGTAYHTKRDTEIIGTKSTPENVKAEESTAVAPAAPAPRRDYDAEIAVLVREANAKDVETHKHLNDGRAARAAGNETLAMEYFQKADAANKEAQAILAKANALEAEKKAQPPVSDTPVAAPVITSPATSSGQNCDLINSMNDFPLSLKLSTSFTLGDLIRDPKHVIADQMLQDSRSSAPRKYTKQEIVCNLKGLAENVLEPLISLVPGGRGGFIITSGYRFAGLTANESKVSDHPKGNAVDIVLSGKNFDYQAHYELAGKLAAALPFHQIILEYRDPGKPGNSRAQRIVWIHIAHRYVGAAKQAFTMLNDKTYGQGFTLLA